MNIVIGALVGAGTGVLQFVFLSRLVSLVGKGKFTPIMMLYAILQVLIPLAVLLVMALVLPEMLLSCGIALAAALIALAVISVVMHAFSRKKEDEDQ